MTVFLASPGSQMHAHAAQGMPWLISFWAWRKWLDDYIPTSSSLLIDSGAFSELNSGVSIDPDEYEEWARRYPFAVAHAALDSIHGDTERTLRNAEKFGFPTFHEADPIEALPEFIELARKRNGWLGIGMTPPRNGKAEWLRSVCERLPDDLHVHGWALVAYWDREPRLNSVDSTTWWRVAMRIKGRTELSHLTMAECVEIQVKKYARMRRVVQRTQTQELP